MTRKIVARVIVAVLLGIATGYAVGKSLAKDAAEGRELTLKQYIADFENHKEELTKSKMPMGIAVFSGILMVVLFFGVYEVLVLGVDKLLALVDRRRNILSQPGTPPPW
jgi:hypothetical protein